MTEQLQNALAIFVQRMLTVMESAGEQLPMVIQEYLTWGLWYHAIITALCVLGYAVVLYAGWNAAKARGDCCVAEGCGRDSCHHMRFRWMMGRVIMPLAGALVLGLPAAVNLLTLVKILVAPRVYLIDTFRAMLAS